jgi:hypothetical protein
MPPLCTISLLVVYEYRRETVARNGDSKHIYCGYYVLGEIATTSTLIERSTSVRCVDYLRSLLYSFTRPVRTAYRIA